MVDIFERLEKNAGGPIGMYMGYAHGYFAFPKLEGEIGPHMTFRGQKMLNWSLNNYLGLANHPEVREADAKGAAEFGMAAPMGARMMSGQTKYHEQLERELAEFVGKPDAFLLNFGYQGMISIIDCLLTPRDVVVYDAEAHACILQKPHEKAVALPHLARDLQTALCQMNISFAHFDIAVAFQRRHGLGNARLGYAQVFGDVN